MILHNVTDQDKGPFELWKVATRNQNGDNRHIKRNLRLDFLNNLIPPEPGDDYVGNGGANYNLGKNRKDANRGL